MSDETPDKSAAPSGPAPSRAGKPKSAVSALKNLASSVGSNPPNGSEAKPVSAAPSSAPSSAPEAALAKAAEAQSADETKAEAAAVAGTKAQTRSVPKANPASRPHTPVVKAGAGGSKVEGVTPVPRPTTAGEYARTTSQSASNTAVIPVVKDSAPSPAQAAVASAGRQASLKLVRVDPWSVTRVVFALTVALMIVAVVAVTILWIVLSFAGVWDQINSSVTTVLSDNSSSFDITQYLGFTRIVGLTLVISAINVVIVTAVATIGAYLYNLAAQLLGGVDVTLAEED